MRKLLVSAAAGLVLIAGTAQAASLNTREDVMATCENGANQVAQWAAAHQSGVPLSETLRGLDPSIQSFVIRIYQEPRYSSHEYQQRFIAEQRDTYHTTCLSTFLPRVSG